MEWIDDGDQLLTHVRLVACIDREHVVAAMQVGGQFDGACALASLNTHDDACRQTVCVAKLGVGYQGIVGNDAHLHRLACKIPLAVGLDTQGIGAERQQHSCK